MHGVLRLVADPAAMSASGDEQDGGLLEDAGILECGAEKLLDHDAFVPTAGFSDGRAWPMRLTQQPIAFLSWPILARAGRSLGSTKRFCSPSGDLAPTPC
jgi:hypothetical protein